MKTITVNRANWVRALAGKPDDFMGESALLNEEGNMCCLGFICHQTGTPKYILATARTPGSVICRGIDRGRIPKALLNDSVDHTLPDPYDSELANKAISINDTVMPSKDRERELKKLFAGIYNLEFVGKTPSRRP